MPESKSFLYLMKKHELEEIERKRREAYNLYLRWCIWAEEDPEDDEDIFEDTGCYSLGYD